MSMPKGLWAAFVEYARSMVANGHVCETKPGRYGGTFATREIAVAYAQWISP